MNQSTHRNDSLVHSHIATLQSVFFFQRLAYSFTPPWNSFLGRCECYAVGFGLMKLWCFVYVGK